MLAIRPRLRDAVEEIERDDGEDVVTFGDADDSGEDVRDAGATEDRSGADSCAAL